MGLLETSPLYVDVTGCWPHLLLNVSTVHTWLPRGFHGPESRGHHLLVVKSHATVAVVLI